MALHIELKYLNFVSSRFEGFRQKKSDLWNCRCMICNDSQKKKSKKRGFFYVKSNNLFYRCFNCGHSTTFSKILELTDPFLYKEFVLENFIDKGNPLQKINLIKTKKPIFEKKLDLNIPSLKALSEDHIAKQYVEKRKIPKISYKDLFYAEDFKKFVQDIKPDYEYNLFDNDKRLIIPFRNYDGTLIAFQGRTLENSKLKFITVKLKNTQKIFGLDRLSLKEKIHIVESPIDSFFIKNCIAVAEANLEGAIKEFDGIGQEIILIPDREPKNRNICNLIEKYINNGRNVCLFPETLKGKDINEFIINGTSKIELQRIIDQHTFSGLRASLEFTKWKKI